MISVEQIEEHLENESLADLLDLIESVVNTDEIHLYCTIKANWKSKHRTRR